MSQESGKILAACHCNGTGLIYVGIVEKKNNGMMDCVCKKQRIIAKKLDRIPPKFRVAPRWSKEQRAVLDEAQNLSKPSLFLSGPTGGGKSWLLWTQYKTVVEQGDRVLFYDGESLVDELMGAAMHDEFSPVQTRLNEPDPFHLFVDDIGAVTSAVNANEHRWPILQSFWNRVYEATPRVRLTITSMLDLKGLRDYNKLPPAVIRRLEELCDVKTLPNWSRNA